MVHVDGDDLRNLIGRLKMSNVDFVGHLYSSAVDPSRFEELLESWTSEMEESKSDVSPFSLLGAAEIREHVANAVEVLRLIEGTQAAPERLNDELARMNFAAFALTREGAVLFANAAALSLDFRPGARWLDLAFEREDLLAISREIADNVGGRSPRETPFRLRPRCPGRALLLRVHPQVSRRAAIKVSVAQINWPDSLARTLAAAFDLTAAECEVLKGICLGATVKELAASRGSSVATIRSQIHALLAKTDTRSQAELVSVALGLANMPRNSTREASPRGSGASIASPRRTLILPDGRRLDWLERGPARGRPIVWFPSDLGFTHWTPRAEAELARLGVRTITPIRAGYGFSSQAPKGSNIHFMAVRDTLALMDHLKISSALMVSLGDDLRLAVNVAHAAPRRVHGIVGLGPGVPASRSEHFAHMTKWARFMRANAKFAPSAFAFVVRAGMNFARRTGRETFLKSIFGASRPDLAALADPEILSVLMRGSEITLSTEFAAHEAFAAEGVEFQKDWSSELEHCPTRIVLFAGRHDPLTPFDIVRDYAARSPQIDLREYPDEGYLCGFSRWADVVSVLDRMA